MIEERNVMERKAEWFFEEEKPCHVKLKDGKFYNGFVYSMSADFFEIREFNGQINLVFFQEVNDINHYKKRGEDGQP